MSSLIAKVVSVQNDARELSARVVEIVTGWSSDNRRRSAVRKYI